MNFLDSIVAQAWKGSGKRCECNRARHGHGVRCGRPLSRHARGTEMFSGWEARHVLAVAAGGENSLGNCEILCQEYHKKTGIYGS